MSQVPWVELGRVKVGAAQHVHLEVLNELHEAQVLTTSTLGWLASARLEALTTHRCPRHIPQVLNLESVPEEQGFTLAASAAARGEQCDAVAVQPGQTQLLRLNWRPVTAGAVRCSLHLLLNHATKLQVPFKCPCLSGQHASAVGRVAW